MSKKSVKPEHDETFIEKIGEQASHLKEGIIAGKDHLVEMASTVVTAVKEKVQEMTHKNKKPIKKIAKKAGKEVSQIKKSAPKKSLKKASKKVARKK